MSNSKQTVFEKLEIKYVEKDGILYPDIKLLDTEAKQLADVGKYGRMWAQHLKDTYPIRYRELLRFDELHDKAFMVNELAYALLEDVEKEWINSHKHRRQSFWEMYQLRMQARLMAEEIVMVDVVRVWH